MKWYEAIVLILLVILFSPLLAILFLAALLRAAWEAPRMRKKYKSSCYYQDLQIPYTRDALCSPEYRFYNGAKKRGLSFPYVRQKSNGLEYAVLQDTLFVFPNFDSIDYEPQTARWEVCGDYGYYVSLDDSYQALLSRLDADAPKLPVKILVETKFFMPEDLKERELPTCLFLTWSYDTAFGEMDSLMKPSIPQTAKELYDMMRATPDLCGSFELTARDEGIRWKLYEDLCVDIAVDERECYFGVGTLIHWHPDFQSVYEDVCNIGRRTNVLVIHEHIGGSSVLYMGEKSECPYSPDSKKRFGKLYYLEAK